MDDTSLSTTAKTRANVIAQCICPKCQATMKPTDKRCWLCSANNESPNAFGESASVIPDPSFGEIPTSSVVARSFPPIESRYSRWDTIAWCILGLCAVMSVLIAIGIAVDSPGGLIPFAIVLVPSIIVTLLRGFADRGPQGELKPQKILVTLLISWVITMGAVFMLSVAAVVLMFLVCLTQIARP
ncbi:MAG: hypothetical protein WCI02_08270 [Planctomycetota bacterium]